MPAPRNRKPLTEEELALLPKKNQKKVFCNYTCAITGFTSSWRGHFDRRLVENPHYQENDERSEPKIWIWVAKGYISPEMNNHPLYLRNNGVNWYSQK